MADEHSYEFVTMGDTQALLREAYSTFAIAGDRTSSIDVGPLVTNRHSTPGGYRQRDLYPQLDYRRPLHVGHIDRR